MEMIYEQLKKAGVQIEQYPHGIHVPITKESREIIEQYKAKINFDVIYNRNDHQTWYSIPLHPGSIDN
jgi:hypothetical protein